MKRFLVILASAMCINAPAYELSLTQVEKDQCDGEGGCIVLSREMVKQLLMQAHAAGRSVCERQL